MKLITILMVLMMSSAAFAQMDDPVDIPIKVAVSFHKVYIPQGFDSNDRVQIVGEGLFSNSCYRPALVTASVDHESKIIKLKPEAYKYSGPCLQVVVTYSSVVNIGVLKTGTYSVVQGEAGRQMGTLRVKGAQVAGPDDHIYAPVNQALLTKVHGKLVLTLAGTFTNSCMQLERVKVKNQGGVIVVQPIAYFDNDDLCEEGQFPFKYENEVYENVDKGRYLLHVRSMNGEAINSLVDVN